MDISKYSDEKLVELIQKRFDRADKYAYDYHDLGIKYYQLYRSYQDKTDFPWHNNIFVPFIFTLIETSTARNMAMYSTSPVAQVVPRAGADAELCTDIRIYVNYFLENPDYEYYLEQYEVIKNKHIYGNGTMMNVPEFEDDAFSTYIGPRFDSIDFFSLYPDPSAKRGTRANWMILRYIKTWEEIEDLMIRGIYDEVSQDKIKENYGDFTNRKEEAISSIGKNTENILFEDKYEVIDYIQDGRIITLVGRSTPVRDTDKRKTKLPYRHPFTETRFVTNPGEYFGSGIPELVESLQEELNKIRTDRRNNVDLVMNKMFKRKSALVDLKQLIACPGGVIDVQNQDDIETLEFTDVTQNAYQEEALVKMDIENTTGEWTTQRGGPQQRREAATTIMQMHQTAQTRFNQYMNIDEKSMFRQQCKQILLQGKTFMASEDIDSIVGNSNKRIQNTPVEKLMKMYDYQFNSTSSSIHKDVRIEQLGRALDLLMKIPPQVIQANPTQFQIDMYEIVKELLENLDFRSVEDRILKRLNPGIELQSQAQASTPGGEIPIPSGTPPEQLMMSPDMGIPPEMLPR